jgi:hypothetical protein
MKSSNRNINWNDFLIYQTIAREYKYLKYSEDELISFGTKLFVVCLLNMEPSQ